MKYPRTSIAIGLGTILASIAYPIIVFVLALQVEGYSHIRDHISELGVSGIEYAWALSVVLVVDAVLVFALAFAVRGSIGQPNTNKGAWLLLALFGVALFIGGAFPCDVNCRPSSFNGWMHTLNLLPSIIATIGAPFLMRKKFAEVPQLSLFSTLAFIIGTLMIVFVILAFSVFPMLDMEGLGQRLVLVIQLSFFILTASAVIHVNLEPQPRPANLPAAAPEAAH